MTRPGALAACVAAACGGGVTPAALETRLQALRQELYAGQQALALLEQRRASLTETLLRISGAVQVLEELLASPQEEDVCQTPSAASPTTLP
jgi:hypothetical protein